MLKRIVIVILCFMSAQTFAQWKSYYPEGKSSKKKQDKIDNEKNKKLFETHFFNALRAKSLEDYDEA